MTISNETVEPATARLPTFSGRVTLMRYQLKLTLPLPRASSVAGSITGHRESSKPAVACMGGVIVGPHGSSRGLKVKAQGLSNRRPRCLDRKSTRLNSSHQIISYAVFCLKKKKIQEN